MNLQHWSVINLEMINWEIYLVNNLSTLLPPNLSNLGGIKNEGLEVVETPSKPLQTPPHPFLKNFQTR